jgi:hypothetical protein
MRACVVECGGCDAAFSSDDEDGNTREVHAECVKFSRITDE